MAVYFPLVFGTIKRPPNPIAPVASSKQECDGRTSEYKNRANPTAYDPRCRPWYQDAVVVGNTGVIFTKPYEDAGSGLLIVTVAPVILSVGFDASLTAPIGESASDIPALEMFFMVIAALVGWKGGERLGLFGASILGPMFLTLALSLLGVIHHRPPAEAIVGAQFMIGIGIGVGYVGVTLQELKRDVIAGMAFVAILAVLALLFTEVVLLLGLAPPLDAFLAFAPGGQAEMTLLAILVGADLGFVIVHHLTRLFIVITCAPIFLRFFA